MSDRLKRWLVVLGFFFIWELLYINGRVNDVRFSHPIGIVQALLNTQFARGFGIFLLQLAVVSIIGIMIGGKLGALVARSPWWSQAILRFLQIGAWLPFLIYWSFPIWPPRKGYEYDPIFWSWTASATAVALYACYQYLITGVTTGLDRFEAHRQVVRTTIFQALFITLISQGWIFPYGWVWFPMPGVGSIAPVYASQVLLAVVVFLLGRVLGSDFEKDASVRGKLLLSNLGNTTRSSILGTLLLWLFCFLLWQILAAPLSPYTFIRPPSEVFLAAYKMFFSITNDSEIGSSLWPHVMISLIEISGGLILSGAAAFVVSKGLSSQTPSRRWALALLPLTYLVPFLVSLMIIHWIGGYTGPWRTTLGVGLLSFFPFTQALWGLREKPTFCRVLLAAADALPYAFVAMIVGETMNAISGLAFLMVITHKAPNTILEGFAAAVVIVMLLMAISSLLQWATKRVCL